MPRPSSTTKIKSETDAFRSIGERLRKAAHQPNIHRYKPHPKQELFHKSTARGRLFIGGNRSGKTVGGAVESVMYARKQHPYKRIPWETEIRGRVVTTDLVEGLYKIVLPEIRKWIPPSDLINGSWEDSWDKTLRTLTLQNGSFIEFLTYEQELVKFAGTSRHFTWFDEEPSQDIFMECRARLIDTRGDWWITMTPVEGLTWTYEQIYESKDPNIFVIEIEMDENPHISKEEIEDFFAHMSEEDMLARRKGQYVSTGGFIYSSFLTPENIIDPVTPPPDWLHFAAMDHGFTNPTAWLWMAVDREGRIVVYHEYYKNKELINHHAKVVLETNRELKRTPAYYVGDPSIRNTDPITGTSVHLEYLEHGVPIVLGNNDPKAGILRVSRLLQGDFVQEKKFPKLFVTRDCVNLIQEMRRLRWATWKNKKDRFEKNPKEEQNKKDDHACDALRYGVSSRPEVDTGEFTPPTHAFPEGASKSVNPMDAKDSDFSDTESSEYQDFHLGGEW